MGGLFSALSKLFASAAAEQRVLMLGLDAAGKTTVLYKIHCGETVCTVPTIGFNVETVQIKSTALTVWDVGGQHKIRNLWHHYFQNADAVVYVVDSSDAERQAESCEELKHVLDAPDIAGLPLLVYANKQDLPNALACKDIAQSHGLLNEKKRPWHVQACTAKTGDGLFEGMHWLMETLKKNPRKAAGAH